MSFQYRLSKKQKTEIAQNLIDILKENAPISSDTRAFIVNWLMTGSDEKRKAFFDVWDLVLKNYLPDTRPILFRSCKRKNFSGRIASFTSRLECVRRFSKGKGSLLICDTKELLDFETKYYEKGSYKHTFFPLVDILKKAKIDGNSGIKETILDEYIGEEEYIMRLS